MDEKVKRLVFFCTPFKCLLKRSRSELPSVVPVIWTIFRINEKSYRPMGDGVGIKKASNALKI